MAVMHGQLPQFDGNAEDWEVFTEQLTHYCTANAIEDPAKKRSFLLSACGTGTYKLIKTLFSPAEVTTKSFDDIVKLVQDHFQPKPSVIMRRFRFNTSVRQPAESVTAFVARLRDLATHCEYGDAMKEMIRDRLVCGIRNDGLQRSLLAINNLSFEKALDYALLHEAAERNTKVLNEPSVVQQVSQCSAPFTGTTGTATARAELESACYRCGGQHWAKECRFKDSVCNYCRRKGHIQLACRNRASQWQDKQPTQGSQSGSTNNVAAEPAPTDSTDATPGPEALVIEYPLYVVGTDRVAPYTAAVQINGVDLTMEIDTGAAVSLISESTYTQLWPDGGNPELHQAPISLRTYTGEELALLGKTTITVTQGGKQAELELFVVKGRGPSLLGRDWLSKIRLNWTDVHRMYSPSAHNAPLDSVLDKYNTLSRDELGSIQDVTATRHIDPSVKPRYCRPRSLSHPLRPRVEPALEKLESNGIIEPMQFFECAPEPNPETKKVSVKFAGRRLPP